MLLERPALSLRSLFLSLLDDSQEHRRSFQVLIKRVMTRGSAKFALPWAAVPATAVWNGFVGHIIMRQAKLRGVGVAMAIELYSIIADMSMVEISDLGKLQMCRAVACNIVKQRDMFPTKEILLKHAVANMVRPPAATAGAAVFSCAATHAVQLMLASSCHASNSMIDSTQTPNALPAV